MESTWYDPDTLAWLPGVVMGITAAVLGVLTSKHAPSASHPTLILGGWLLFKTAAVLLTIVGIVAAWTEQPYGIWYGLMLPGLIGIAVAYIVLPGIRRRYAGAVQSEHGRDTPSPQSSSQDPPSETT